ncbi:MAG: GFA family protein [Paracoccus sp. (in: a-proteobacteria)]|nr:GFA family protein [Paracoccus sp. (in: a-proteobacteria)]
MVQPAFSASDFQVIAGKAKIYRHVSQGSGKAIYINFCDECGTKLFQTFERFEGAIGVFRGTFDDPNWVEVTADNSKHIFLGIAQKETVIPAHTPAFKEHAMQSDGSPIAPIVLDAHQKITEFLPEPSLKTRAQPKR